VFVVLLLLCNTEAHSYLIQMAINYLGGMEKDVVASS
jgi:hypothetical protein